MVKGPKLKWIFSPIYMPFQYSLNLHPILLHLKSLLQENRDYKQKWLNSKLIDVVLIFMFFLSLKNNLGINEILPWFLPYYLHSLPSVSVPHLLSFSWLQILAPGTTYHDCGGGAPGRMKSIKAVDYRLKTQIYTELQTILYSAG